MFVPEMRCGTAVKHERRHPKKFKRHFTFMNFRDNTRVDPPFWWAGMKRPTLQVMIYRSNIGNCSNVNVESKSGVTLDHIVHFDSPNYISLHLNVKNSTPEVFKLTFSDETGPVWEFDYELRERLPKNPLGSFDSSDMIYLVLPDRFSRGNSVWEHVQTKHSYVMNRTDPRGRHGGDILGLQNHLDYLEELGVTCIWPTPCLENDTADWTTYHGYGITDFYAVDRRLGTNEGYLEFVRAAHARGMKVIIDLVFNHCSWSHHWYEDKPTKDWFHFPDEFRMTSFEPAVMFSPYASEYDLMAFQDYAFNLHLPDLNQKCGELETYMIQNSIWWVEYADLNGIRMDTFPYCDEEVMNRWVEEVNLEFPDLKIMGECWTDTPAGCAFWQKGNRLNPHKTTLHSVLDFPLSHSMKDIVCFDTTDNYSGFSKLYRHLCNDFVYPDISMVVRFIDNHDVTQRFFPEDPSDIRSFKQAITIIATIPGIPQLYYGTEVLMSGDRTNRCEGFVRRDFPGGWAGDPQNCFKREGRTPLQNEAFDFCKTVFNFRKRSQALSRGSMKIFRPQHGVFVYSREYESERVIVIMNGNFHGVTIDLSVYTEIFRGEHEWFDIVTNSDRWFDKVYDLRDREVLIIIPRSQ